MQAGRQTRREMQAGRQADTERHACRQAGRQTRRKMKAGRQACQRRLAGRLDTGRWASRHGDRIQHAFRIGNKAKASGCLRIHSTLTPTCPVEVVNASLAIR